MLQLNQRLLRLPHLSCALKTRKQQHIERASCLDTEVALPLEVSTQGVVLGEADEKKCYELQMPLKITHRRWLV